MSFHGFIRSTWSRTSLSLMLISTGKVTVWASTQGPFAIRSGIAGTLGIPLNQVNVIATTMGGGFGGRFGVALTHVPAVLLSQKTGRPVKIQMTREESLPMDGRHRGA